MLLYLIFKEKVHFMKKNSVLEGWLENDNRPIAVDVFCMVYNHGKYLREALDGILIQQTNFPVRIIIHDDASTDDSVEIICEYQKRFPDKIISVIETENLYQNGKSIWERMYPYYTAKYIAYCEGDDFWTDPKKLQKQVDYLEKNLDCVAVYHNILPVDDNSNYNEELRGCYCLLKEGDYSQKEIKKCMIKTQTASLVHRNFYPWMKKQDQFVYKTTRCNGDEKYLILCGLLGRVHYLSDVMAAHRKVLDHGDSWSARYKRLSEVNRFLSNHNHNLEKCKFYEYFSQRKVYRYNTIISDQLVLLHNYPDQQVNLCKDVPFYAYIVYIPMFIYKLICHIVRKVKSH